MATTSIDIGSFNPETHMVTATYRFGELAHIRVFLAALGPMHLENGARDYDQQATEAMIVAEAPAIWDAFTRGSLRPLQDVKLPPLMSAIIPQ